MEKQESNFENVDGSLFLLQSYYKREKKKVITVKFRKTFKTLKHTGDSFLNRQVLNPETSRVLRTGTSYKDILYL